MVPTSECPEFLHYESVVMYEHLTETDMPSLLPKIVKRFSPMSESFVKRAIDGVFGPRTLIVAFGSGSRSACKRMLLPSNATKALRQ